MRDYTVQAGDTLGGIAARELGDAARWREIADLNQLADPNSLHVGQVLRLPEAHADDNAVAPIINPVPPRGLVNYAVSFVEDAGRIYAQIDGEAERLTLGRAFRKGLYRVGDYRAEDFLRSGDPLLADAGLSESEINALLATAENEGALDAVNTWDNSFLSFGIFQWTAGTAGAAGELPALLARIRARYPAWFQNYWGQFGLDVEAVQGPRGWLTLNGRRLVSEADKTVLRAPVWALRFARAGADRNIQAMEVAHAIARLDSFYFRPLARLGGHALADLVTSEYGVALLLDNHVNRPAYVSRCVALALARIGLSADEAAAGDTDSERQLIEAYLDIRRDFGRYPMTDADGRAAVTRRYLDDGLVSDERGSFESNREKRNRE